MAEITSPIPSPFTVEDDHLTNHLPYNTQNDSEIEEELELIDLEPPSDNIYNSQQEAIDIIHAHSILAGYDLGITSHGKNTSGSSTRIYFECVRGGRIGISRNQIEETRARIMRGSMKLGACPMKIMIKAVKRDNPEGPWKIVHQQGRQSFMHNHGKYNPEDLPGLRRRARMGATNLILEVNMNAGIRPAQTLASLSSRSNEICPTVKDIDNERQRLRRQRLERSGTMSQSLVEQLQGKNYWFSSFVNESNSVERFYAIHPECIKLLKECPEVLVTDCTYRTNRYNRPLLNIVGVHGSNATIPCGLAVFDKEDKEAFLWALDQLRKMLNDNSIPNPTVIVTDRDRSIINAISEIFPNSKKIICRWHMKEDVEHNARLKLGRPEWSEELKLNVECERTQAFLDLFLRLFHAKDEAEYDQITENINESEPNMFQYLQREWYPHKECLFPIWVDRYTHFGTLETSRVEGNHAWLKAWIQSSRFDLAGLFDRADVAWGLLIKQLRQRVKRESIISISYQLQGGIFKDVRGIIHRHALQMTADQLEFARRDISRNIRNSNDPGDRLEDCNNCRCFRVYKIPCKHLLYSILEEPNARIQAADFHYHWWLSTTTSSSNVTSNTGQEENVGIVLDPAILPRRVSKARRMIRRGRVNSTTRAYSAFEMTAPNDPNSLKFWVQRDLQSRLVTEETPLVNSQPEQLGRRRAPRSCSICGMQGHNYRRCSRN